MLTGQAITFGVRNGSITISPFRECQVNPNSYNLRLGDRLLVHRDEELDARKENPVDEIMIPEEGLVLSPGRLYLGCTEEQVGSDYFVPQLSGRSSVGRLGLFVHVTAGFGDLGYHGRWTLELCCVQPVRVYAGMEICQVYFSETNGFIDRRYAGKYQGDLRPEPSKLWKDFKVGE